MEDISQNDLTKGMGQIWKLHSKLEKNPLKNIFDPGSLYISMHVHMSGMLVKL